MIAWAVILIAVTAVPPLNDSQQAQLDTAIDDSPRLDESALYPLLENALAWDDNNEAGAAVPDYDALLDDPIAGRGGLFLIEGKFAGRARRYRLVRKGEWGDALTEWVLVVRDEPEQVAVVYFVDPQDELIPPHTGSDVRVAARFYKVWADRDQDGNPTRYLTFIAASPSTTSAPAKPVFLFLPMVGGVLVLAVVYLYVRRMSRPQTIDPTPDRQPAGSADDAMLSDGPAQPMPQDPAEALRRLAQQHDEP